MTSLTPHEDAVRALLAQAADAIAEEIAKPGERAMRHRLNDAVGQAFLIARAQELDRGATLEEVHIGSIVALGNLVATIVSTDPDLDTESRAAVGAAADLLADVFTQVQARLGPGGRGARATSRVFVPKEGRS